MKSYTQARAVRHAVHETVQRTPILDIHTHLYQPRFWGLLLRGPDELLTYHYLVAEVFRVAPPAFTYEQFWKMKKTEQSAFIWEQLFEERAPISEACRGVLTALTELGAKVRKRDLKKIRRHFARWTPEQHIERVFKAAGVTQALMTNNPFDDEERPIWEAAGGRATHDGRFRACLRLDDVLVHFPKCNPKLQSWGYKVSDQLNEQTCGEIRRFLQDWCERIDPVYMAVSLPPTFAFPHGGHTAHLIEHCILPVGRERNLPFAMMIGVKKLINPALQLAGDGVGKSDICAVENLCANFPQNKFLVTMLSRENQHELCVAARKFRNLHVFGCWWFLNNPSIIEEMTRERLELLGLSVTPQHSDARVLDQLAYKWPHSRKIIAAVLGDKFADVVRTGWTVTQKEIDRDVKRIFGGSFLEFLGVKSL
ncbi:MAG: glucuronate isomerase [Planctomycetota bacterium]